MLRFVSRSIDLLEESAEESGNAFRLSRRGYLFATAREAGVEALRTTAREVSAFGMGALREHATADTYEAARAEGYRDRPTGADLLVGDAARRAFPYLAPEMQGALHVRRAGWMNAVALGAWLLRRAIGAGVTVVHDAVTSVDTTGGRVRAVRLASGRELATERVVLAPGPMLHAAGRMLGLDLPVALELHAKMLLRDPRGAVPREAPFVIWNDGMTLPWSAEERAALGSDESARLLEEFPGGVHARPVDGPHGDELWLIWTYDTAPYAAPTWPPAFDPHHGEILLRGASRMIPGLSAYLGRGHEGIVDGGYYCKTPENRPLIGPLPVEGAFVVSALSGYGVMAGHGAGELLAAHVVGAELPRYAAAFLPSRYDDPAYLSRVTGAGALAGQL
jgi:glycine/D-amino acid oxidase-like deaminating enzyme